MIVSAGAACWLLDAHHPSTSVIARLHPVLGANRFTWSGATVVTAVVGVSDRLLTAVFKPPCRLHAPSRGVLGRTTQNTCMNGKQEERGMKLIEPNGNLFDYHQSKRNAEAESTKYSMDGQYKYKLLRNGIAMSWILATTGLY